MLEEKKRYKTTGYIIFWIATELLLLRIIAFFTLPLLDSTALSEVAIETISDLIFTGLSQIVGCFLIPFLLYKYLMKKPAKQVFAESNFKKVKWWILPLCFALGIVCFFVTIGISALWSVLLTLFGYNYPAPAAVMPENFNIWLMLLSIFLTAVLPGFCEEFAMRGVFVRTMRHTVNGPLVIILSGIAFGLFHQNVTQVFYAALFGGFLAYLVMKTNSIYLGMVIHFTNNFLSVVLSYADNYKWGISSLYNGMFSLGLFSIIGVLILFGGLVALLTWVIIRQSKKDKAEVLIKTLYVPSLRESAFYIGAIVMTALATIITFAANIY
jgi:membrane protease YdiL (CAAX protease family)